MRFLISGRDVKTRADHINYKNEEGNSRGLFSIFKGAEGSSLFVYYSSRQ